MGIFETIMIVIFVSIITVIFQERHSQKSENEESKYENMYFMETGIWSGNEEQPPRKTKIISIAEDMEELDDNDDVAVLSEEGNWYTIKKREVLFEE